MNEREKKDEERKVLHWEVCTKWCMCVCASCSHLLYSSSHLSDLGLLVHSRDIFKKKKKKEEERCETSRSGQTDCLVLLLWLLEDWWLLPPPSWWCQGHAKCFCWEWKDFSRHRSNHLQNACVGMFLCLFIFKFCPVKTRKKNDAEPMIVLFVVTRQSALPTRLP